MTPTSQGLRVALVVSRRSARICSPRPSRRFFRDDLVELVDTPVDPAVFADAVRTAAWRSGLGGTVLPLADSGKAA